MLVRNIIKIQIFDIATSTDYNDFPVINDYSGLRGANILQKLK